jgi:hypothetical protein
MLCPRKKLRLKLPNNITEAIDREFIKLNLQVRLERIYIAYPKKVVFINPKS